MEAVKELDMKLKYVNRLRGLNRNHPDLQAAVDSCVEECKIVLAALSERRALLFGLRQLRCLHKHAPD